jgi:hypothetical protein
LPNLAGEVRQQPLDVVLSVGLLLRRTQRVEERLEEGFQTGQDAPQQTGRDLRIVEQFVQAEAKGSLQNFS